MVIPTCFCVILIPTSKYQSLRFSAISMNSNLEVLNLANVVGLTATAVDAITRRCSKYVEMLEIVWRSLIQVSKKNCMEIIVYMTFGLKLREPKVIKIWQVKLTPWTWLRYTQMADKKTVNVIFFSNSVDKNVFKLSNEGRSAVAQI